MPDKKFKTKEAGVNGFENVGFLTKEDDKIAGFIELGVFGKLRVILSKNEEKGKAQEQSLPDYFLYTGDETECGAFWLKERKLKDGQGSEKYMSGLLRIGFDNVDAYIFKHKKDKGYLYDIVINKNRK